MHCPTCGAKIENIIGAPDVVSFFAKCTSCDSIVKYDDGDIHSLSRLEQAEIEAIKLDRVRMAMSN